MASFLLPPIMPPGWLVELVRRLLGGGGPPSGGTGPLGGATNPLTMAQAEAAFQDMASQPHIPFGYAIDGCYARAHEMRRLLLEDGIETGKAWNYGSLMVPNTPVGDVQWGYHVAPTVWVQGPGGPQQMVIDPSMSFGKPVTAQEWAGAMNDPGARLEFSGSDIYYRPEGAPAGEGARDDNYESTAETLRVYTEEYRRVTGGS